MEGPGFLTKPRLSEETRAGGAAVRWRASASNPFLAGGDRRGQEPAKKEAFSAHLSRAWEP